MAQGAWKILDDAVRIGIVGMRPNFQFVVLPARRKDTPMRGMRPERRPGCRGRIRYGRRGCLGHSDVLSLVWHGSTIVTVAHKMPFLGKLDLPIGI